MGELRGRGLRMAILTNNVREWEALWRAKLPRLEATFEVVVDSAWVGMRKPDPEIYRLTVERLGDGLRTEECVFVDDTDANCETARALGMHAVHFSETGRAVAEIEAALGAG
jgi:putative hydrolase of the HAD superfamily